MTLDELAALIHAADCKKGGCAVTLTTINVPPSGAVMYGIVTLGTGYQRNFHSEEELRDILEGVASR